MNVPYLSNEIAKLLLSADRPEFNLIQRYETYQSDQKLVFVLALIGKLIEQDRMLKSFKARLK